MGPEETEVRHWIEKAHRDRRMADLALGADPPIVDSGAFPCQQAAEKLLKAYLVRHEQEFEKTHDVRLLLTLCARIDPAFEILRPQVVPLTAYAVRFRYPGPGDPTVAEVEDALRVVEQLTAFVTGRLPAVPPAREQNDADETPN